MAHNPFIRTSNINYHDFTQKKIYETQQQLPQKFRQKPKNDVVLKPVRQKIIIPPPLPPPIVQIKPQKPAQCKICCCGEDFELRNYKITLKRINDYHFNSCQCPKCKKP